MYRALSVQKSAINKNSRDNPLSQAERENALDSM